MTTITYRKLLWSDTWHFCKNCHLWPRKNFKERRGKPASGEFCDHCKAKSRCNNCAYC